MRIRVPGPLIHAVALGWTSTWRIVRHGRENLDRARAIAPHGGFVGALWHRSLLMAAASHHHQKVAALASRSGDGALIAEHLLRVGIRVVRGSSHRGAVQATRELSEALAEGWALALACDGPKGPPRIPKAGAVDLARRHGAPILPFGCAAARCWELPTWDSFRLPWPGTRIGVVYGEPIVFPPDEPDAEELARRTAQVAAAIDACEAAAARLVSAKG